eukprot:scaffold28513_cov32-Tisochrysis_lutea.AAC.3
MRPAIRNSACARLSCFGLPPSLRSFYFGTPLRSGSHRLALPSLFQVGAELNTVLLILRNAKAVDAFASASKLTLGLNLSVAIGPVGRCAQVPVYMARTIEFVQKNFSTVPGAIHGSSDVDKSCPHSRHIPLDMRDIRLLISHSHRHIEGSGVLDERGNSAACYSYSVSRGKSHSSGSFSARS